MSTLRVVLPDILSLHILPLSPSSDPVERMNALTSISQWCVFCGHHYLIQMKFFSQDHGVQEMFITESDDLRVQSDQSAYWKTLLVSSDSVTKYDWRDSRILSATSQELGKLTASLIYFSGYHESKEVLKVVHGVMVMVCEQVKFSFDKKVTISGSQLILLPWVPGCAKTSSDCQWFSSDKATVSISASAKRPGKATVGGDHPLPAVEEAGLSLEMQRSFVHCLLVDRPVNELDFISDSAQAAIRFCSSCPLPTEDKHQSYYRGKWDNH